MSTGLSITLNPVPLTEGMQTPNCGAVSRVFFDGGFP
jgi:hypothetical protein